MQIHNLNKIKNIASLKLNLVLMYINENKLCIDIVTLKIFFVILMSYLFIYLLILYGTIH